MPIPNWIRPSILGRFLCMLLGLTIFGLRVYRPCNISWQTTRHHNARRLVRKRAAVWRRVRCVVQPPGHLCVLWESTRRKMGWPSPHFAPDQRANLVCCGQQESSSNKHAQSLCPAARKCQVLGHDQEAVQFEEVCPSSPKLQFLKWLCFVDLHAVQGREIFPWSQNKLCMQLPFLFSHVSECESLTQPV